MSLAIGPLARSTRAKCNGAVFFHRRRPCCGHSSVRSRGPADPTRLNCVSHDSSTCSEKWFHKSNSKRDRVFPTFLSESSQYGWTNLASLREHVRSKRCAATPPRGHRPFYVGSRALRYDPTARARVGVAGAQKNQRSYKCLDFISKARLPKGQTVRAPWRIKSTKRFVDRIYC